MRRGERLRAFWEVEKSECYRYTTAYGKMKLWQNYEGMIDARVSISSATFDNLVLFWRNWEL